MSSRLLLLLSPAANRVYAGSADRLAAAELQICAGLDSVDPQRIAGIDYLAFDASPDEDLLRTVAGQSARLALFEEVDAHLLRPRELPVVDELDDDFVTIPKYQGKTNEQFTRLLLNVTLSQVTAPRDRQWTVLDPLAGRGTTAAVAWLSGLDAAGVEADQKSVEAMAGFWKTWLRRKRLKHSAEMSPVRREGKSIGKRFDVTATLPSGRRASLTVFTGDTRNSKALFGKRRFEAIVADAPYGVVHGSRTDVVGVAGKSRLLAEPKGTRDRSPAGLLGEAVGGWAEQLVPGGALGVSWNTLGLSREDLAAVLQRAGLEVRDGGPWLEFAHRVDSSINRDLLVAHKPD
ncbi:TRM11 family SAM-dependent methyltransferase [Enemella evansiae]|uniref:TRM11 family SAM-dependent methyltransferase n=1 Tax=Enemella evansiae TaxID=2016499 RepID=UPI001E40C2C7|nr:site-specific DNA-methyltransferase [Enemella evansiae]